MPRAQAPSEILLQKPQIPSICTDILSLLLRTSAAQQPLRVPDATERKIGNRQNLLYYRSSILSPSSLCKLYLHLLSLPLYSCLFSLISSPPAIFLPFLLLASPPSFHLPILPFRSSSPT